MSNIPLDRFPVLVFDMNSTFMFHEDRFGLDEDFAATYHRLGGRALSSAAVDDAIRTAYAFLDARYVDPLNEDDFPSLTEAFTSTAPGIRRRERELLEATFAEHERGTVPKECVEALHELAVRHERRLLTNIWAPKTSWVAELDRAGVLPLFRRAVFSSDTRSVKPSLRLTSAVLEDLPCAPHEVLMIGDSLERDLRAARRAGLSTVWISAAAGVPTEAVDLVDFCVPSIAHLTT